MVPLLVLSEVATLKQEDAFMRQKCISNICNMYLDVPFGCQIAATRLFFVFGGLFSGQKQFKPLEDSGIYP